MRRLRNPDRGTPRVGGVLMADYLWSVTVMDEPGSYANVKYATVQGAGRAVNHALRRGAQVNVWHSGAKMTPLFVLELAFAYERDVALKECFVRADAGTLREAEAPYPDPSYPRVPSEEECAGEAYRARVLNNYNEGRCP